MEEEEMCCGSCGCDCFPCGCGDKPETWRCPYCECKGMIVL